MAEEINREEYLQRILEEIKERKKKGKRSLVRMGARIDHNVVGYIREYFENRKNEYLIEITNKCNSCKTKWDIIIYFIKD
jgi:hypothetical protein